AVFIRDEFGHVADMMHDAELHVGLREDGFHSVAQTGEPIAANDQRIVHSTSLQIVEHLEPEAGTFGFFNPQPEHLLPAGNTDAEHGIHTFLQNAFVSAYGHAQAIDENNRVDTLQGPVLPIDNLLLQLVGGAGNELGRDLDAINILDALLDLARGQAACIQRDDGFLEVAD